MRWSVLFLIIFGTVLVFEVPSLQACNLTSLPVAQSWQSSIYDGNFITQIINALKNGNTKLNGGFISGLTTGSCKQTTNEIDPWLQMQLDTNYYVMSISVTSTVLSGDMLLRNISIDVANISLPRTDALWDTEWNAGKQTCVFHEDDIPPDTTLTLNCTQPVFGNYVRITKITGNVTSALWICSVVVEGSPTLCPISTSSVILLQPSTASVSAEPTSTTAIIVTSTSFPLPPSTSIEPTPAVAIETVYITTTSSYPVTPFSTQDSTTFNAPNSTPFLSPSYSSISSTLSMQDSTLFNTPISTSFISPSYSRSLMTDRSPATSSTITGGDPSIKGSSSRNLRFPLTSTPALMSWISSRYTYLLTPVTSTLDMSSFLSTTEYHSTSNALEMPTSLGLPSLTLTSAVSTNFISSTPTATHAMSSNTGFGSTSGIDSIPTYLMSSTSRIQMSSSVAPSVSMVVSRSSSLVVSTSVIPVWCPCLCEQYDLIQSLTGTNKTNDEVAEEVEELLEEMTVDSKTTTVNQRKLNSADDSRSSAKIVGTVGIAFFIGTFVLIILSDLPIIIRTVKKIVKYLRRFKKSRRLERSVVPRRKPASDVLEIVDIDEQPLPRVVS